jgi:hypothetical protein
MLTTRLRRVFHRLDRLEEWPNNHLQKSSLAPIQTIYLDRGLCCCDEDFRHNALKFYEEIRQRLEDDAKVNSEAQRRLEARPPFKARHYSFGISAVATVFPDDGHH